MMYNKYNTPLKGIYVRKDNPESFPIEVTGVSSERVFFKYIGDKRPHECKYFNWGYFNQIFKKKYETPRDDFDETGVE